MKDVYYFRHDANAHDDLKLKSLRKNYGWQGYGWYWYLIEMLRNEDEYCLEYSEFAFDSLALDMGCEPAETKAFINYCVKVKLLEKNANYFYCPRLNRDMEKWEEFRDQRRDAALKGVEQRIARYGTAAPVKRPLSDSSSTRSAPAELVKYSIVYNSKLKENIENNNSLSNNNFKQATDLWTKALSTIKSQVNKLNFKTNFSESKATDLNGDTLTVTVPGLQALEALQTSHLDLIERVLTQVAGEPVSVKFELVSERAPPAE